MSTNDGGPEGPPRSDPRPRGNNPRSSGSGPRPGSAPRPSGGQRPGSRGTQERRSRQAERMAQQRRQAQQRRFVLISGSIVVIAAIIAAVLIVQHNNGAAAVPTPTPVPSASPVATLPPAPAPSAAELAASKTNCAPFLAAAQKSTGKGQWSMPPKLVIGSAKHYQVKIYTDRGVITADLLPKLAPITANNFAFLTCNNFYDSVIFHRTIPDFMIQGGDPLGTGSGGPGYQFQDEKVARPYQVGDLAMANSGANTNGSQFFIIQGSQGTSLPASYNLFGHVTSGISVVNAIVNAPAHMSGGGDTVPSAPNTPVHIRTITLQVS